MARPANIQQHHPTHVARTWVLETLGRTLHNTMYVKNSYVYFVDLGITHDAPMDTVPQTPGLKD